MKLQRYGTGVKGYGFSGMQKDDEGKFCAAKDVEALEAENAALHAECDRLTSLLQWEQGRRERIGTHGDECWKWGPSHYECASREIERITAMLGPQRVLRAEEVTEPGFYWWGSNLAKGWDGIMKVARTRYGYRFDEELWGAGSNGLYGQFIGPIKMPEVQE